MSRSDPRQDALRVLIVCQGDLGGASEKQALGFAQQLALAGHAVMLSLYGDETTAEREGAASTPGVELRWHHFLGRRLRGADRRAARAFAPTLIHAFNPRAAVVAAARSYRSATGAPVLVHWEDDETGIRHRMFGRSAYRRVGRLARHAACAVHPPAGPFVTPRGLQWVAGHAAGHDALTPALADHVEQHMHRPCSVVLPVTPRTPVGEPGVEDVLGDRAAGRPVLMITGEIHPGSVGDVRIALQATADVQRRGHDVVFVHAGRCLARYDVATMSTEAGLSPGSAMFLGYLPFARIPGLLRRATILLQPGEPSEFNRLRLPSKMQAYLAAGVPTITFAVGFGELLTDGEEALLLHSGQPGELADHIHAVLDDERLRRRLAAGARRAADRLFDPERNAAGLVAHYRRVLRDSTVGSRVGG